MKNFLLLLKEAIAYLLFIAFLIFLWIIFVVKW